MKKYLLTRRGHYAQYLVQETIDDEIVNITKYIKTHDGETWDENAAIQWKITMRISKYMMVYGYIREIAETARGEAIRTQQNNN